jgi:hypothetical protein
MKFQIQTNTNNHKDEMNSWGNFHPYYVAEAVVFGVVAWTLLICYCLQILAERKNPEKLGRVHRIFHGCGVLVGIELVITAIDPQGIFGILRWDVLLLLKDICGSAVGYIPLAIWTTTLIIILGEQHGDYGLKLSRHMERHYKKYSFGAAAINLAICIVTDVLAILGDTTLPRAFGLLYLSVSFFTAFSVLIYTLVKFYQIHNQTKKSQLMEKRGCCSEIGFFSQTTRKIRNTALVFLFMALMQLQSAIGIASKPTALSTEQVPADPMNVHVFYWILPYWLGLVIGLYGSWLPLDNIFTRKTRATETSNINPKSPTSRSREVSELPAAAV